MKKIVMALPSFIASGVAALPVLTCPACLPLYAGLLSTLGLGFIDYTPFLLPVTAVLLVIALAPLAWKARQRWGYKPLLIGMLGAVMILAGKFEFDNQALYYAGIAVLLAASIWNIWSRKKNCHSCVEI
jgi:mercuric ion transport protein